MKERQVRKIVITLNFIIVALFLVELYLPFNISVTERFERIYTGVTKVPAYKGSGGFEVNNYIQCKSGNYYKLGIVPLSLYTLQENEQIVVRKTPIFSKTKEVSSALETTKVLFLFNKVIIYIIGFATLLTLVNIYFPNNVLDFISSFASIFIYFIFVAYLIYY